MTYSLTGDSSGGGFTINAATGVVTVADATKIDFETAAGHAYTVTVQASDGTPARRSSPSASPTLRRRRPSTAMRCQHRRRRRRQRLDRRRHRLLDRRQWPAGHLFT